MTRPSSQACRKDTVVVVGDHAPKDQPGHRHPLFMVKVARAQREIGVTTEVATTRVFDLVVGLLQGAVRTPEDVVSIVRRDP